MKPFTPTDAEFYVGYLPTPPGQATFLRRCVAILVLSIAGVAAFTTQAHNNPGAGRWSDSTVATMEGRLETVPYPMLLSSGESPDQPVQVTLLVGEGKFGIRERAEPLSGRMVRVRGTVLARDGRRMVEVVDGDGGLESLSAATPLAERNTRRSVTLQGEIIDPKCYLGAMKPGEGKAHKECATLCISGGIPPMFITREPGGVVNYFLLADKNGRAVGDAILPLIADPVELRGDVEQLGDLRIIRINPSEIRRL